MKQHTPLQAVFDLDVAFNKGDLEEVLNAYEKDAVVVIEPGKLAVGKDELRKIFSSILKLGMKAKQIKTSVIEANDIALFISSWVLEGVAAEGKPFTKELIATTVFRKQENGLWKIVIDNSFGPAIL